MSAESLELAFADVETSAAPLLDGDFRRRNSALRAVFALNNEIGKLARSKPASLTTLKAFQAHVNGITVAVKSGNRHLLRESLESTRDYLVTVSKGLEQGRSTP